MNTTDAISRIVRKLPTVGNRAIATLAAKRIFESDGVEGLADHFERSDYTMTDADRALLSATATMPASQLPSKAGSTTAAGNDDAPAPARAWANGEQLPSYGGMARALPSTVVEIGLRLAFEPRAIEQALARVEERKLRKVAGAAAVVAPDLAVLKRHYAERFGLFWSNIQAADREAAQRRIATAVRAEIAAAEAGAA